MTDLGLRVPMKGGLTCGSDVIQRIREAKAEIQMVAVVQPAVLLPRLSTHIGLQIDYGSRAAQPKRVRAFLEVAIGHEIEGAAR